MLQNNKNLKGDPLGIFFPKKFHNAEKLKGWSLWVFSRLILSQYNKKLKGTLWGIFSEKVSQCRNKTERVDPLVSRPVLYVTRKKGKTFFKFSSLGHMVQFDTSWQKIWTKKLHGKKLIFYQVKV